MKHYRTRSQFWGQFAFAMLAAFLSALLFSAGHTVLAVTCLTAFSLLTARSPSLGYCRAVTLSVPEILMDVLDAFKLETPELFSPGGFGRDFSSKTAVLGDKITAKIAHVPTTASYDPAPGKGFYNGAQDVTTLIEDVPVTLSQFRHVPIKIGWLTQLSSKLPLYKEAIRNYGWALGKYVVDSALAQCTPANFQNSVKVATANVNLDTMEAIRSQLNAQKVTNRGRWMLTNTPFSNALGNDDRVKSSLFYGALNGDNGYRLWKNISGFGWVREYPDMFAGNNLQAFAGDARAIVVATRRPDFSNVAAELGVPQIMEFYPIEDEETGLFMTGVAWQEVGTGDVYVSASVLFGVGAGSQGTGAGNIADNAGCLITTS